MKLVSSVVGILRFAAGRSYRHSRLHTHCETKSRILIEPRLLQEYKNLAKLSNANMKASSQGFRLPSVAQNILT